MTKTIGGAFFALLALAAAQPLVAGVIVGLPSEGGNCFPFGCSSGTHYQQMYAASQFSGPITITDITFYGGDSIATGTYTFSLSTSPLNVFTMSTSSFAANIGSDNALFFSGVLGGPVSGSFTVAGTPFAYNPANGDRACPARS